MGIKDMLNRARGRGDERRELIRQMDQQTRIERIVADRQLSSNERELNQLRNEKREEAIKEELDFRRKERDEDIRFGHNPLDVKNITNHVEWEVMKEPNQFSKKSNMFENNASVLQNNPELLKTNHKLLKGGNMFKI